MTDNLLPQFQTQEPARGRVPRSRPVSCRNRSGPYCWFGREPNEGLATPASCCCSHDEPACSCPGSLPHAFVLSSHAWYLTRGTRGPSRSNGQQRSEVTASGGAAGGTRERSDGLDGTRRQPSHASTSVRCTACEPDLPQWRAFTPHLQVIRRILLRVDCQSSALIEARGRFTPCNTLTP